MYALSIQIMPRHVITSELGALGEYKGAWNPAGGAFPSGATKTDLYRASASGTVDGIVFATGDLLLALADAPSTSVYANNWSKIPVTVAAPITDHGALSGLGDDDHTQYHTDARANTWLGTRTSDNLPVGATNLYLTGAERAKLAGIEPNATADQSAAEVVFDPAGSSLLSTDVNAAIIELDTAKSATGHSHALASGSAAGFMSAAQFTKLAGIETAATADQDAADVPFTPTGNLVATNVQDALVELQTELDGIVAGGGAGDMLKATYDPTNKNADAFSMGNMVETVSAKILTAAERTDIANAKTKLATIQDGAQVNTVTSVHGRSGAVVSATNDYEAAQIDVNPLIPGLAAGDVKAALSELLSDIDNKSHTTLTDLTTGDPHTQYLTASSVGSRATFQTNWTDLTDGGLTSLHTHSNATTSVAGFLSAADKSKLDGIQAAAQVNTVFSVFGRTEAVVPVSGDYNASQITVTPVGAIAAANVQAALAELDTEKAPVAHSHAASVITVTPGSGLAATDAQAAFNELQGDINTINTTLPNKSDVGHTHAASVITVVTGSGVTSNNVQDALVELQGEITTNATDIANKTHNSLLGLTTGDPHTQYLLTSGARALTGNQSAGGFTITNLGAPTGGSDAATKTYVDTGLAAKADTGHSHSTASTSVTGFMSNTDWNRLNQLNTYVNSLGLFESITDVSGTIVISITTARRLARLNLIADTILDPQVTVASYDALGINSRGQVADLVVTGAFKLNFSEHVLFVDGNYDGTKTNHVIITNLGTVAGVPKFRAQITQTNAQFKTGLVFRQVMPNYFVDTVEAAAFNKSSLTPGSETRFSVLEDLEQYRRPTGEFRFRLVYPTLAGAPTISWHQTSNPVDFYRQVEGFSNWSTTGSPNITGFVGLSRSGWAGQFLSGQIGTINLTTPANVFFEVGTLVASDPNTGVSNSDDIILGPNVSSNCTIVELYVD